MIDIEQGLRALVTEVVRKVIRDELADATKSDEFLSVESAAKVADVHRGTIRRWVREQKLTRHSAGRVVRVSRAELERWIRDGIPANGERELTPEQEAAKRFG